MNSVELKNEKETIKSAVDIVTFINDTHSLSQFGDEWKGYTEPGSKSKASLSVNKDKQVYDNHATGDKGDLFSWIAYRDNLNITTDFPQILSIAADYAGIKLKNNCDTEERDTVLRTLNTVVEYYHTCLNGEYRQYIHDTWGISDEIINKLKIGYAPANDPAGLQMAMKDLIPQDDLVKAGVVYESKIDIYRGRIIFPYWGGGKVMYTIGRATELTPATRSGRISKYLKQLVYKKENPLVSTYIKNDVLYGVDSLKDADEVIITEGVTDCISMLQSGIPCISPVTVSFRKADMPNMLQLVKGIKTIYVCNDNDGTAEEEGAGDKGAFKTIEYLKENGLNVRYIQLPREGEEKVDLADYMKDHTIEEFRVLMDNAVVYKTIRAYTKTDTGNAQQMNCLYGEDLMYCHGSKQWLIWDSCRWKTDKTGTIDTLAKKTVEAIHDYAGTIKDETISNGWKKHALSSLSAKSLMSMVVRLRSEEGIPVLIENMDYNDWILPVKNGTLDLKTGKFRESKREDMCTKIANVLYDPSAGCPEFLKFLEQIQPDPDTRLYIQKCLGYSLTGDTTEEQVYFNLGNGWNGKNTLMDVIVHLLGEYALNIDSKTILTSDTQTSTTDYEVARMKGARLVTASEPETGKTLNDAQIKKVTNSGAKITARRLYQEPFDYYPTHKLFFSANQRPYVKDNTTGTWRRLRIIPFNVKIDETNRDSKLPTRLAAETSGILNWLIDGCKMWQKDGLEMCDEVRNATADYRADMDVFTEFLKEFTEQSDFNDIIPNVLLRDLYNNWAVENGYKTLNPQTLSSKMRERGHEGSIRDGSRVWHGFKIKPFSKRTYSGLEGDLKGDETLSSGLRGPLNQSCTIGNNKISIEKLVGPKTPLSPLSNGFSSNKSTASPIPIQTDAYLSKEQKTQIIREMKLKYEENTGNLVNLNSLREFGVFVHEEYDKYAIDQVMIDTKNRITSAAVADKSKGAIA